ncbi:MAG TPA: OmpH family outer membrane protein [Chiayiivirga sp.]|nr:OmpH family outer membrane protein [Chiayiivirga sp.]
MRATPSCAWTKPGSPSWSCAPAAPRSSATTATAGSAAAPEDRDGLKRQADALRRSIERTRERLRDELNARVDEETERAWPLINDAIAEHGRAQGYDLIVTSPVAYVSGRIDVTDDVLALLRRQQQDGTR